MLRGYFMFLQLSFDKPFPMPKKLETDLVKKFSWLL